MIADLVQHQSFVKKKFATTLVAHKLQQVCDYE